VFSAAAVFADPGILMKFRSGIIDKIGSVLIAILALGSLCCFGARPYQPIQGDPLLEFWRWRTFPDLSGLDVQCMSEGRDGTMWFGTANGLWSYDGIEWRHHSTNELVGRVVTSIWSKSDGILFAAGGRGISQFSNGQWTQLLATPLGRIVDLRDIPVRRLAAGPDGALWAATSWGALVWRGSMWTLYTDAETAERLRRDERMPLVTVQLLPDPVIARLNVGTAPANRCDFTEVCADAQGRIWFGTKGGNVLCYAPPPLTPVNDAPTAAPGAWSLFDEADGAGTGQVSSICPMQDGQLWVVHAASEHANVFDGRTWTTVHLPIFLPMLDMGDAGGKLLQTRDGVIWLSARFALFAYRDGQWRKYEQPEVPFPSIRNVVMQSKDGALWFGGPNGEIHRLDYQTPRWLTLEDLNFQWENLAGTQWFLHRDGRIVVNDADQWTSYGVEDGLIDTPVAVSGTRSGEVWVAGSHEHTAATARFDGQRWTRDLHDDFSFAIDWRAVFESSDGSMWFGALVDTDGPKEHRAGVLQFQKGVWTHHHQPGRSPHPDGVEHSASLLPASKNPDRPIEKFTCIGESRDGKVWAGRSILARYDGNQWEEYLLPPKLRTGNIEAMLTTGEGDLWLGTREFGALRYDGKHWQQFQGKDSLVANSVRSLTQTTDGSIWAVTDRGTSRFDGRAWMAGVLPEALNIAHESGGLKSSPSGGLWINHYTLYWMRRAWAKSPPPDPKANFRTVRHQFHGAPPSTTITAGPSIISQPGNLSVLWSGVMPWHEPEAARLQFSYRLDNEPWSDFTSDRGRSFFTVPTGKHRLEVRARDHDFNVDPSPATLDFMVLPPVWRQSWFIALMILLGGLLIAQSIRVWKEQARLRAAHDELEVRVRQRTVELEAANSELETFSYSVSHDLRAPLRIIDGFSRMLMEDCSDKLAGEDKENLHTVRAASQRMGNLIDDMLRLTRINRGEMRRTEVDLSEMAGQIVSELKKMEPGRQPDVVIAPDCVAWGDAALLRIALENMLGNAWKYTGKKPAAKIEFGVNHTAQGPVYFVRDNGAGFDMAYVDKLFGAFQRLHTASDFPGTGVGLAIVQRVIQRHGGRVWAEASVDGGATFLFTLGKSTGS
jgi:signal transduction histidine kinase/ligand-binding sensor domain-containing protein